MSHSVTRYAGVASKGNSSGSGSRPSSAAVYLLTVSPGKPIAARHLTEQTGDYRDLAESSRRGSSTCNHELVFRTRSEEETIALGRELAPGLSPGAVLLIGNLGAGKTTLAKGIVAGLNATPPDEVSSPTFTRDSSSTATPPRSITSTSIASMNSAQLENLGLDDLFNSGSVVLLEWAERFPTLLPGHRTEIRLRALTDETREIIVSTVM